MKTIVVEGPMKSLIAVASCLILAWVSAHAQAADAPAFEVASIKPSPSAQIISCTGGPGTASPGIWRCLGVRLSFLIYYAYRFEAYQFRPNHPCCPARFDITAKVPLGVTKEQFQQMLQSLLAERFKLTFHLERKEMAIFELTVGEKGPKMKEAAPDAPPAQENPPWAIPEFTIGKDGYPVFPAGRADLQVIGNHYRWTAFNLSMQQIVKTLSFHLGRQVVDATGLRGKYDINLTWTIDLAWLAERAGHGDQIGEEPDDGPSGPTLIHAVRDQLGLKLISKKGSGDIVVIDHVEKVPIEN